MPTVNLKFNHVADNQNNKEPVFNTIIDAFDTVITDTGTFTVTSNNALTLTEDQFKTDSVFNIDPDGGTPPTAQITMTVPRIKRGPFAIRNNTLEEIKVTMVGQLLVDRIIEAGKTAHYHTDGNTVKTPHGAVSSNGSVGSDGWSRIQFFDFTSAQNSIEFLLPANSNTVKIIGWLKPTQDDVDLHLNFSIDDGDTFEESSKDYRDALLSTLDTEVDSSVSGSALDTKILLAASVGNATNELCAIDTKINGHRNAISRTYVENRGAWIDDAGVFNRGRGGGIYRIENIVNFAKLSFSANTIAAARIMIIALPDKL